jgi:hypothetical protein
LCGIDVVALSSALHFPTFPAVYVQQFEIVTRSRSFPSLVRTAIAWELLHVGSIGPAISGDVQNLTAVYVSHSVLPAAQVYEFPALICPIVAGVLLEVGVLVCAASENINASSRIDVSD